MGYSEAKEFQTNSIEEFRAPDSLISVASSVKTFLRSFELDNIAPHRRQQTERFKHPAAILTVISICRKRM